MSANARITAFAVVLSVFSLCGYASPASSQDSNEGNSDDQGFKGVVAPARSYDIAPPFDGQVIEIHFKPGEYVEEGQAALHPRYDKGGTRTRARQGSAFAGRAPASHRRSNFEEKRGSSQKERDIRASLLGVGGAEGYCCSGGRRSRHPSAGRRNQDYGDEAILAVCRRHEPPDGCRRYPSQRADDHGHDLRARSNLGQGKSRAEVPCTTRFVCARTGHLSLGRTDGAAQRRAYKSGQPD